MKFATKSNHRFLRAAALVALLVILSVVSGRQLADTDTCGGRSVTVPFMDVAGSIFFCQIAEAYFSGLTNGTDATHYSPSANVTRDQMAAFITRTQDSALRRGSRRAALNRWETPIAIPLTSATTVGTGARGVASDGADLWVANTTSGSVSRVRASDGKLLETWTGATAAWKVIVTRGRVYILGGDDPGHLYRIDPRQTPAAVSLVATVGSFPRGIATDGESIWITNSGSGGSGGSVSKVNPDTGTVQNFTLGFIEPIGILFDGRNIWVTDSILGELIKLNSNGSIAQAIAPGGVLGQPVFDGTNIWIPRLAGQSFLDGVIVVRASTAEIVATLTGNGLSSPQEAAFDGQRVLVSNFLGNSLSLWRAVDLVELGSFSTINNAAPRGACSDGIDFWITFGNSLARF